MFSRPLILGHRGAPEGAPENTQASLRLALLQGADGAEFDVQALRGGDLALYHDTVAGGRGVWEQTGDELAAALGHPVERFADLFGPLSPEAYFFVEFKRQGSVAEVDAHQRIVTIVRQRPGQPAHPERTIVGSFDTWFLRAVHAAAPEIPLGLILHPAQLSSLDPDQADATVHQLIQGLPGLRWLSVEASLADSALVRAAHRAGLFTLAWSIKGDDLERCYRLFPALTGVITWTPDDAVRRAG